jgi:hypothetical protein
VDTTKTTYEVVAVSKAQTDGSNHTFTIKRDIAKGANLTCTAGSSNNHGGCQNGNW